MATARNPITNDLIKSKTSSDTFDQNYDQIDWSVKLPEPLKTALEETMQEHAELLKDLKD